MFRPLSIKRSQRRFLLTLLPLALALVIAHPGQAESPRLAATLCPAPESAPTPLGLSADSPHSPVLLESWQTYKNRFIQADGRVIDREARDRTVSEGQAYAMLRAVAVNDPDTFHRTYTWAKHNLARLDEQGQPRDRLWAWHWGQREDSSWGALDQNFATDADIDAATALIWAADRWQCSAYLDEARALLQDIWRYGTVALPDGSRQLLPGPAEAFFGRPDQLILNPSYFAPASFRLFAQVDPGHPWLQLVDSGYGVLEDLSEFSDTGLPPDWVAYNPVNQTYRQLDLDFPLQSRYSFDAIRVWWRIGQDAAWFGEPRADAYLQARLPLLIDRWQTEGRLPARLTLDGSAQSSYEATAHYAMLYPALRRVNPAVAEEIYQQKLRPAYAAGLWDNDSAYYTQNLAWFGLLPLEISPGRIQAQRQRQLLAF